jgi:hypothetical protein
MASILKVDALQGITSAGDITVTSEGGAATQSLQQGLAKAWANFHQNGTQSIDGSINIASITDGGTGESSFTFSNALSNGNDNIPTTTVGAGLSNTHSVFNLARTTVVKIETYAGSSYTDASEINVLVHGDLA